MKWNPAAMMRSLAETLAAVFALAAVAALPTAAHALSTDADQPIEIEADFAELDDQDGTTIYIGNVIVVQGSIRMKGDKLRVNFTPDYDLTEAYLEGRPAYFKQTPDGGGPDIEGVALQMEFHRQKNLLHLIEKARVTQGDRLFEGYRINYDTEKSIITARGVAASSKTEPGAAASPPGRVKVIIPPQKRTPPSDSTASP